MKRLVIAGLVACLFLPIAGCWDVVEIRNDAFLVGMGIDQSKEGRYEVSLLELDIPPSTGGNSSQQPGGDGEQFRTKVYSSQGSSIAECMEKVMEQIEDRFTLEKINFILFGNGAAQQGLSEHWDYIFRAFDLDPSLHMLVAEGQAKTLLEQEKGILVEFATEKFSVLPNYLDMLLWQFTPSIYSNLEASYMPIVRLSDKKLHFGSMGLFTDSKMVMSLEGDEQKFANIFLNKQIRETILFSDDSKKTAFRLLRESRKIHLEKDRARVTFKLKGMIAQSAKPVTVSNQAELQQAAAEHLKMKMTHAYDKMRQKSVDLFGFGEKMRQRGWDVSDWESRIKDFPVTFDVQVEIMSGFGKLE